MPSVAIDAIAEYHNDVDRSLRFFFSELSPDFGVRFFGLTSDEIREVLDERLEETDQRSGFFILTSLEAAFRVDYEFGSGLLSISTGLRPALGRAILAVCQSD